MPRKPDQTFACEPLAELLRQLLFAPPDKRVEQARRAERLHDQIEPQQSYPFDFVAFRITGFHAEHDAAVLLVGQAIRPDLRLLIDALSRSVSIPVEPDEPVVFAEDLAEQLGVSTRTLSRWRSRGLRWRWVVDPADGRRRIAHTQEAIDLFTSQQADLVRRAARFTQIDPPTRRRLLERARRLAQARQVSLNEVARHLARRAGRAVQTIRQLLEQHDRDHPADPIFADRDEPLTPRQKRLIGRAFAMGLPVAQLTRRFNRTRSTIYRAIHEQRAAAIMRTPISFIELPTFSRPDADEVILRPQDESPSPPAPSDGDEDDDDGDERPVFAAPPVDDLPEQLQPLYRQPVLDEQREVSLFVRLNYLYYKAAQQRDHLDRYEPRVADLDRIESCLSQARLLRDRLFNANLPVVLAVANQHLVGHSDRSVGRLIELLELGHAALIEAISGFDPSRGQTFRRFLTWTLTRRLASAAGGGEGGEGEGASDQTPDQPPRAKSRAHRRQSGQSVLQRMRRWARASDVRLRRPDEDQADD